MSDLRALVCRSAFGSVRRGSRWRTTIVSNRRDFLLQAAAAGIAVATANELARATEGASADQGAQVAHDSPSAEAEARNVVSYEQYLEDSAVPRDAVDRFLRGTRWAHLIQRLGTS